MGVEELAMWREKARRRMESDGGGET